MTWMSGATSTQKSLSADQVKLDLDRECISLIALMKEIRVPVVPAGKTKCLTLLSLKKGD